METEQTIESRRPVSIEAASFRISLDPEFVPEYGVGVPGRCYHLEALDKDGNAETLRRVKSFKFEVDGNGYGLVTITYIDHDPT